MDGIGDSAGPNGVEPKHGQIAEMAYQRWVSEGRLRGRAVKNWAWQRHCWVPSVHRIAKQCRHVLTRTWRLLDDGAVE